MVGVARLDVPTYEDIERDTDATSQALIVVVLAAIAGGIGALGSHEPARGFIGGIVAAIVGWIVFSVIAYFVGSTLFATPQTSATIGQLLRTLGFARGPQLLTVFGFIPVLGGLIFLIASIWVLVTSIIAVRQSLDFTTGRAIGTAIVAAIVNIIIVWIIFLIFGISAYVVTGGR